MKRSKTGIFNCCNGNVIILLIAFFLLGFINVSLPAEKDSIIYRHDANEDAFIELGSEMAATVSLIGGPDRGHFGSGVFITENWVLTAAHNINGQKFAVINKDKYLMTIDTVIIHPQGRDALNKQVDLALVKVQGSSKAVASLSNIPLQDLLGKEVAIAGFGILQSAMPEGMPDMNDRKLRAGTNIVDQIGGEAGNFTHPEWKLLYDLDKPGDTNPNPLGESDPTKLEAVGNGGDSGGGMYLKTEQGWSLVGVIQGGQVNITNAQNPDIRFYGTVGSATAISPHMEWISQIIESH